MHLIINNVKDFGEHQKVEQLNINSKTLLKQDHQDLKNYDINKYIIAEFYNYY